MLNSTPSSLDSPVLDTMTISLNGPGQSSGPGISFFELFLFLLSHFWMKYNWERTKLGSGITPVLL